MAAGITHTESVSIHELLVKKAGSKYFPKHFEIPSYQREFSWEDKQVTDFLSDLKAASVEGESHFLGPIYHHKTDKTPESLLDGQQRMTAVQITAAVLLDIANREIAQLDSQIASFRADDKASESAQQLKELKEWAEKFEKLIWRSRESDVLNLSAEFERDFVLRMLNQPVGEFYTFVMLTDEGLYENEAPFAGYAKAVRTTYDYLLGVFYNKASRLRTLHITGDKKTDAASRKALDKQWYDDNYRSFDFELGEPADEDDKGGESESSTTTRSLIKHAVVNPQDDLDIDQFVGFSEALLEARVISVTIKGQLGWHKIFETLNSRGRALRPHERIRNHLFSVVATKFGGVGNEEESEQNEAKVLEAWRTILDRFRDTIDLTLDEVIHYYLISHFDEYVGLQYKDIVEPTFSVIDADYEKFIKDLDDITKRLANIFSKTESGEFKDHLEDTYVGLVGMGDKYAFVPAIATASLLPSEKLVKVLQTAENFTFRARKVLEMNQAAFQTLLVRQSRELNKNIKNDRVGNPAIDQSFIDNFRASCLKEVPDDLFKKMFDDGKVRPSKSGEQSYILSKFYRSKYGIRYDPELKPIENQVEHIYPKSPRGRYPEIEAHVAKLKKKLDDDAKTFVHQIGNLCLLEEDINRTIQNRAFHLKVKAETYEKAVKSKKGEFNKGDKKNKDYRDSKSKQVEDVIKGASGKPLEWRVADIERRNKEFGAKAVATWPLS